MSIRAKRAAAFLAVWALMVAPAALAALALWSRLDADQQRALGAMFREGASLVILVAAASGFTAWAATGWLFARFVTPSLALTDGVRVMITANPAHRLVPAGSAELSALAGALNAFADERQMLLRDVEARIAEANRRLQEERNRLAALVSDLAQSVLVCNEDGRILLYNARARAFLEARRDSAAGPTPAAPSLVGLGRSVFAFFDRSLVTHALESVWAREQKGEDAVASFVTTLADGRLVRLQVAPVRGASAAAPAEVEAGAAAALGGFVLVFDDVTPAVESGSRTAVALERLIDASRRALGSIRAAVETLVAYPGMPAEKQSRFMAAIAQEAASLTEALERTATEHASPSSEWLLEDMSAADLVSAIATRIERELGVAVAIEPVDPALWVKVDSYALVQALETVATGVRDELGVRQLRLRIDGHPARHVHLDVGWSGANVPPEALSRWEAQRASGANASTLKQVVERHGGELWFQVSGAQQDGFLRILLPATRRDSAAWAIPRAPSARPEYYDFDLFHQAGQSAELDERPLAELSYTVFDTETTGLEPSEGDEIVCIGAVRIVNGRLLRHECYEQFVDPRRPLSVDSMRVTGIAPEMLAGQPPIERVLPEFHRFCEDTVLVAHNAAFDLRFLQLKESKAGVRFTHPVLDTLLLAAAVQPQGRALQLEAMAERLGVPVIGRHTALGDAIMTGEIFLRLIPLLTAAGVLTLKDAREASERTFRARLQY
jgi:DNA polymerase-3 subunit epsilon